MPRQLIRHPKVDRTRSLGWFALWFVETFMVHGEGDVEGQPIRHGDEYSGFFADAYALGEDGRRLHDSAFLSRPKGADKSGLAGQFSLLEGLIGPRFGGWARGGERFEYQGEAYEFQPGEPLVRQVRSPLVRIMATEEEQTNQVYGFIYKNLTAGPLAEQQRYGLDVGLNHVMRADGGEIRRSTSGAASKDGGRETFAVFDETHLYNTPVLRSMYQTVTQNLPKRGREAEPWYLETTTMFAPGEMSIAEQSYKYAQDIREGKARRQRLLFDHRWSTILEKELVDEDLLEAAIREAYGDAEAWNSVDSVMNKIYDPRTPVRNAMRFYLNARTSPQNSWVQAQEVERVTLDEEHPPALVLGDQITLGFDGAVTDDATALIGCRIADGLLFPIRIEECPDGPESVDWRVDERAFDAAVAETFQQYEVVGFFADPPYWQDWVDKWNAEFGEGLRVSASQREAVRFWTKDETPMGKALERLHTAILTGKCKLDGSTALGLQMIRHMLNARRVKRRFAEVIFKETRNSPKKIDAAVAAALAFEARARFLQRIDEPEEEAAATFVPFRVR